MSFIGALKDILRSEIVSFVLQQGAEGHFVAGDRQFVLHRSYSYLEELPEEVLHAETIEETMRLIQNPYMEHMSAEEYQKFLEGFDQVAGGIGIALDQHPQGLIINELFVDGAAIEAGLQVEDIILSVDGRLLEFFTLKKC